MKAGAAYLALASFLFVSPAHAEDWQLSASKKGDTVELCLSHGTQCPESGGVSPSSISAYRWDNMHDNELVWDSEPNNPILGSSIAGPVTWGVAPKDWTNKMTPPALVCGKAYTLNPGAHYFALKCDGTVTVFEATQLEEFFRENKSATPVKGDPSKDEMGPE